MNLKLKVTKINEDVIATSGQVTYTISGLGDGDKTTFSFTSSDGEYNYTSATALANSGKSILNENFYTSSYNYTWPLTTVINNQMLAESSGAAFVDNENYFNGTYIFDGTKYVKQ